MNTKEDAKVRELENEVREIRYESRGKFGLFVQKYGMQFLVQTLSTVIALTLGYATITNSITNINEKIKVFAQDLEYIKTQGSLPVQILQEQYKTIQRDITDIKASQLRFEEKLDNLK